MRINKTLLSATVFLASFALTAIVVLPHMLEAQTSGGNIGTLDAWTATTSPDSAITQRIAGKTIKITGLSDGCLGLTSSLLTSTGSACGSGGGGGGSPGGASSTVQFNANGSFGGDSSFTFNGTKVQGPNGSVSGASLSPGTGGQGIYRIASGSLGLTNGTNGIAWDGTSFYPLTNAVRNLGTTTSAWNNFYTTNASSTVSTVATYLNVGSTTGATYIPNYLADVVGNLNDYTTFNVENKSAGTQASADITWNNNNTLASGSLYSYADCGLNSSTYTSTTYGDGFNKPDNFYCYNFGPMSYASATSTPANAYHQWLIGGIGAANEVMRLTSTGLGIASTSPTSKLAIQSNNLGATQADTSGVYLQNATAAAVGAQQVSPALVWEGQGWKTTATAASQTVKFRSYVLPVQASANPTATWTVEGSINGAAYTNGLTYTSAGLLTSMGGIISGGALQTNTNANTNNFIVTSGTGSTNQTNAVWQFAGATNTGMRTGFYGSNSTVLTAGSNYSALNIAAAPITEGTSGVHNWLNSLTVQAVGVITNGSATTNNTATLFIDGANASGIATNNYVLYASSTAPTVILSTGAMGVGTTTPTGTGLSTNGTNYMTALTASSATQQGILCISSTNQVINESVACLASAARYKENIATTTFSLDTLMKLQPVSFTWKKDFLGAKSDDPNQNGVQYSLIADEVQKIDPHLVSITNATTTWEGKEYAPGAVNGLADTNHWVSAIISWLQGIVHRQDATDARIDVLERLVQEQSEQIRELKHKK